MFDINKLSPADAAHMIQTMRWLEEHQGVLLARVEDTDEAVSLQSVKGTFHQQYTELTCTRLVPLTISVYTDEDALDFGERREPNILLHPGSNVAGSGMPYACVEVEHGPYPMFEMIGKVFGISDVEQAWRLEVDVTKKLSA